MNRASKAFTLIELLIVVAIIAILAAIAVPNFLEAQTRAKVSRALADMRSLATAIEAYRVDSNRYPPRSITEVDTTMRRITPPPLGRAPTTLEDSRPRSLSYLSSPVSYITSIPVDPFERVLTPPFNTLEYWDNRYSSVYFASEITRGGWILVSVGPDGGAGWGIAGPTFGYPDDMIPGNFPVPYDATNGTVSLGNIFRLGQNQNVPGLLVQNMELPIGL
jgi:prepilin-type N-terminal cleavage/methylation domain-containing protein